MKSGIYKIQNKANNKFYIGQSKNIKSRIFEHKLQLRKGKHFNIHLQSSFDKYGEDAFVFSALEYCKESELNKKEIYWIKKLKAFTNGYNKTIGGNHRGYNTAEYKLENIKTGEIAIGKNIREFCIKHNLPESLSTHFGEILYGNGHRKTCHGWRKLGTNHVPNRITHFKIQHKNGEIYEGSNIRAFSKSRGINPQNVNTMIKGRQKSAYGWSLFQESKTNSANPVSAD